MANGKPPPQLSLSQTSPSPPLPTPAGPTPARPSLIDSFGSSFAKDRRYWSFLGFATLAGLILGLVSSATTNVIAYSLEGWRGDVFGEKSSSSNLTYFAGQLWWIAVVFGGGLTNGLIQAIPFFHYPKRVHCLFSEVRDAGENHPASDMHGAPAILLANTLGLALGGSAGPEAAIAAFGGAFATAIYSLPYIRNRNLISPSDHRLFVLSCMSIGVSSILPSPIIAVSLISELFALSHGLGSVYLKYVVSSGIGGCVAYAVTNGIGTVSSSRFSEDWNESLATPSGIFADYLPLQSILLGIIGCVLGYVFLGAQLLLKQLSKKLVVNLNALSKFKLGTILTPAIGGIFVGVIAWILPGTTGVGEAGMVFLSQQPSAEVDAALFVATGLSKLLSLSICLSFGWTGGMIYPLLFIGSSVGAGISEATGWNRLLCMSCVAASLMSSHMPAPYAFWATTTSVYRAGLGSSYGTLISILVALLFGVALGTKQRLIIKLSKNNELKRSTVYLNLAVDD